MILHFLLEYWWAFLWALAVVAAYVWGGWRVALVIATLGGATVIYNLGRKDAERDARSCQQAKEREDVQTVTEHRSEAQRLSSQELDERLGKWAKHD